MLANYDHYILLINISFVQRTKNVELEINLKTIQRLPIFLIKHTSPDYHLFTGDQVLPINPISKSCLVIYKKKCTSSLLLSMLFSLGAKNAHDLQSIITELEACRLFFN